MNIRYQSPRMPVDLTLNKEGSHPHSTPVTAGLTGVEHELGAASDFSAVAKMFETESS